VEQGKQLSYATSTRPALVAGAFPFAQPAYPMTPIDQESTVRYFTVGKSQQIVATEQGRRDASSIVLLHGAGQTRHSWKRSVSSLAARGYHALALDARGHGDSGWASDADYSVEALADDLLAVIATLNTRPVLVGASMGGLTSLRAIVRVGEQIASALVLVDIVPNMNRPGAQRVTGFMHANPDGFATIEEASDAVAAYNPHRSRPRDSSGLMKNLRLHPDGRLHWHWDPRFFSKTVAITRADTVSHLMDACTKLTLPVMLVRGTESDIVTEDNAEAFKAVIPQLQRLDIPGAGHMIAGDSNDHFIEGMQTFLQGIEK
jgi:pimeloyl-ACP methyl ester carboxylesterase